MGNSSESYVRRCAIRDSYNSAISVQDTNGVAIFENVAYWSYDSSTIVLRSGVNNTVANNLALGTQKTTKSQFDNQVPASFEITAPLNFVTGNVAAGSHRAGFKAVMDGCDGPARFRANRAHSNTFGLVLEAGSEFKSAAGEPVFRTCTAVNGFQASRSWDYGVLAMGIPSDVIMRDMVLADNRHGVLINKKSLMQQEGFVSLSDTLFVGQSLPTICSDSPHSAPSPVSFTAADPTHGLVGTTFALGFTNGPPHRWDEPALYPTVRGRMAVSNVTFAKFPGRDPCGRTVVAFANNRFSPDSFPPHDFQKVTYENVPRTAAFYLHPPDPAWRNPSDCVDMDCDGPLHIMIKDVDGTLAGVPGGSIVGNYHAPRAPIQQGTGISPPDCRLNLNWNAYECAAIKHQPFVIESRDADTETRRVAPVLLENGGVVDVLTGPMDHGWCFGYTCQKRLSTFWTAVATGRRYSLNFTGTPPRNMRLHLPYAALSEELLVVVQYFEPNRIYTFLDGRGRQLALSGVPQLGTPGGLPHGAAYWDQSRAQLHVVVRGGQNMGVEIRTEPVIQVSSTLSMDFNTFFQEQFVSNVAAVLGIDPSRIRVIDVKPGSVKIKWEIGDDPKNFNQSLPEPTFSLASYANPNDTSSGDPTAPTAPGTNATGAVIAASASAVEMTMLVMALQKATANGTLASALGVPIVSTIAYSNPDAVSSDTVIPVVATPSPSPSAASTPPPSASKSTPAASPLTPAPPASPSPSKAPVTAPTPNPTETLPPEGPPTILTGSAWYAGGVGAAVGAGVGAVGVLIAGAIVWFYVYRVRGVPRATSVHPLNPPLPPSEPRLEEPPSRANSDLRQGGGSSAGGKLPIEESAPPVEEQLGGGKEPVLSEELPVVDNGVRVLGPKGPAPAPLMEDLPAEMLQSLKTRAVITEEDVEEEEEASPTEGQAPAQFVLPPGTPEHPRHLPPHDSAPSPSRRRDRPELINPPPPPPLSKPPGPLGRLQTRGGTKAAPDPTELLESLHRGPPRGVPELPGGSSPGTSKAAGDSKPSPRARTPPLTVAEPPVQAPTFKQSGLFDGKLTALDSSMAAKKGGKSDSEVAPRKIAAKEKAKGPAELPVVDGPDVNEEEWTVRRTPDRTRLGGRPDDQMSQFLQKQFPGANLKYTLEAESDSDVGELPDMPAKKKVYNRTGSALSQLLVTKFADDVEPPKQP